MSLRVEEEIITKLTKRCVYPTVMNNILDISDLKSDVLIEHKLDLVDPVNLVIISRNDAVNITIYLKASLNKNKSHIDAIDAVHVSRSRDENKQSTRVRKVYNQYPLIVNTTSAKLILLNYKIDFVIDQFQPVQVSSPDVNCDTVKIPTPLLCNNLHSVQDTSIKVYARSSTDSGKKTFGKTLRIERMVKSVESTYEELVHAKREYIPSIHDVSTDRFHRLNQIRDGFVCMLKPSYRDDTSLSAFIEIVVLRNQINYKILNKNKKYNVINFNGLIVDVCTGRYIDSQIEIDCDVKFTGRYMNGVIGGYVDTIQNVTIDILGDVSVSRSKNSIFSGICSGISRWIDNAHVHVAGDVEITGKVSGLISGSATGIFSSLECKIRDRLDLHNEKRFGTVIGFLSHMNEDHRETSNDFSLDGDNFKFRYLLHINGVPKSTVKSSTSGIEHGIIGELNPMFNTNKVDDGLNEESDDFVIPSNDDYVYDDEDIEGIYEVDRINLNRKDSKSKNKFHVPVIKNQSIHRCNDSDLSDQDLTGSLSVNQDIDVTKYVDDVLHRLNNKQQKSNTSTINDTFSRHNSAWGMFNLIKQTRRSTGIGVINFPDSSVPVNEDEIDKKIDGRHNRKEEKQDKNIFEKSKKIKRVKNLSKKPTISEIWQDDEQDDMNDFDDSSTKDPNQIPESAIYILRSDSPISDDLATAGYPVSDDEKEKDHNMSGDRDNIDVDVKVDVKVDTDDIFDDRRYKVADHNKPLDQNADNDNADPRSNEKISAKQIHVINKKQRGKLYDLDTDTLKLLTQKI